MITYQFINALSDAKPQSHLIARADSSLLPDSALIAEMRQQSTVADARFGCAPFARITLLPDALWHDALTEGLITALRPLLTAPASAELVLDVTDIDDVVLAQVLRFLFNQAHRLSDLKLKKTDEALRLTCITALCLPEQQAKLETTFRQQQAIALGMVAARRLADMPSDRCTPQFVVEEAQKLCAASPALRCEVLDEKQIVEQGLGLLHAVGKGATCPPRLLAIHYNGVSDGPVRCYVGKGITFDTGGLWLKEGAGMYTMKYDMCGAANVLGLMLTVAELKLPVRIMGVLALAENAIGPDAMQPGTVATACNGITVEINNTDAEGRITLADAVTYAKQCCGVDRIVDIATLTDGIQTALGNRRCGAFTNNRALIAQVEKGAAAACERMWELPCDENLRRVLDSRVAHLKNSAMGSSVGGYATVGAMFVKEFVEETPWIHLDIGGTAWTTECEGIYTKGGIGFGTRMLYETFKVMEKEGTQV